MKIKKGIVRKFILFSIALFIMLSFFAPKTYGGDQKEYICYYDCSWSQSSEVLKEVFSNCDIVPYRYEPIDSLNKGAMAVEVIDCQYSFLQDKFHTYPLYKTMPIIAVNRNSTDEIISTWSDLKSKDLTVGIEQYDEAWVLGINQGLEKSTSSMNETKKLLKHLHTNKKLVFMPKAGLAIEDMPDVSIIYDNKARTLNSKGANLEIVVPKEGTVSFSYSLFSKEPIDIDEVFLKEKLELYGYSTEDTYNEGNVIELKSGKYRDIIRAESMLNREIYKTFRPLRTNKFENNITYILLLGIISGLSIYFYFRISSRELRNYVFLIFLNLCFWIIARIIRLSEANKEIIYRYSWYLFYVALIYVPLLFVWISLSVDEKLEEKKFSRVRKITFIIASILLIFVITNDLHNLVFKFHSSYDDYSFNYLMIGILLYYFVCLNFSFFLLIRKALRMPNRAQLAFPSIIIISLFIYIIVFIIFLNNKIAVELTKTVVLAVTVIILLSIYFGLIPLNKLHDPIFRLSKASLEIRDDKDNIVLESEKDKNFETYLIRRKDIKGGSVVWYEDMTLMNKLFKKEDKLNEKLEENLEILKKRYEVERQLESLSSKERLLETVENAIQDDLVRLDCGIKSLDKFDADRRRKKLSYLAMEFIRLKYISNLLILSLTDKEIKSKDLMNYFISLCNVAKDLGVRCDVYNSGEGVVDFPTANNMINWFVESIVNVGDKKKEINCVIDFRKDEGSMMMFTDKENIDYNPFIPKIRKNKNFILSEIDVKIRENEYVYKGEMEIKKVTL